MTLLNPDTIDTFRELMDEGELRACSTAIACPCSPPCATVSGKPRRGSRID